MLSPGWTGRVQSSMFALLFSRVVWSGRSSFSASWWEKLGRSSRTAEKCDGCQHFVEYIHVPPDQRLLVFLSLHLLRPYAVNKLLMNSQLQNSQGSNPRTGRTPLSEKASSGLNATRTAESRMARPMVSMGSPLDLGLLDSGSFPRTCKTRKSVGHLSTRCAPFGKRWDCEAKLGRVVGVLRDPRV